jgi:hypothetical protein
MNTIATKRMKDTSTPSEGEPIRLVTRSVCP